MDPERQEIKFNVHTLNVGRLFGSHFHFPLPTNAELHG